MDTPRRRSLLLKSLPWTLGSLLLLATGLSLYFFTGAAASEPSRAQGPDAADVSVGPADAAVAVIEYSDFQCPFCAEYAPIMETLREEYGDRVRFVFRFFPLKNHPYGMISAQAAYAAHRQGMFWEMHDLLFEHQDEWSAAADPEASFSSYAGSLGLDVDQFLTDLTAPDTLDFIRGQKAAAEKAGVEHTPWFVVGDSVVLPRTVDQFRELIEAEL